MNIDSLIGDRTRHGVAKSRPIIAGDQQRRRARFRKTGLTRGIHRAVPGDGKDLDRRLLADVIRHDHLEVRPGVGQRLERLRQRSWTIFDFAAPEGNSFD